MSRKEKKRKREKVEGELTEQSPSAEVGIDEAEAGSDRTVISVRSITKTYGRKLNMSMHGGTQYETTDIIEQRSAVLEEGQDPNEVAAELYRQCQESVESDIQKFDQGSGTVGTVGTSSSRKKKDDLGIENEEIEEIVEIVRKLASATTAEDLVEIQADIKKRSKELSDKQLNYLRTKYNQKAKEISNSK